MKFSEFVGNDRIVRYFQKAISEDHLGHAYLFQVRMVSAKEPCHT